MTTNAQNSKQFLGQQGSATVPSFSFLGYNTTGVYLPAANKISITTNGTQALTVDASQNVGIGTSSPGYKLDVAGSIQLTNASPLRWKNASGTSRGILMLYSDNNVYLDADDGGQIFRTGGYERMRIDSSGNVGIGVTPSAWGGSYKALQVSAGSLASYTTIASSFGQNYYDSGAGSYKYINSDYASRIRLQSGVISFEVVASGTAGNAITFNQAMTLDNSGNLGIGTASPSYKLDAFAGTTNSAVAQFTGNNSGRGLKLSTAQTTFADDTVVLDAQMASYGTLAFKTGGTERMRIDSSGNVIVGATSSAGSSQITAYGSSNGQIAVQNSTNWSRLLQNSGDLYIDNGIGGSAGNIIFRNSSSTVERMRIDSSGNVGIGISSPSSILHVKKANSGIILDGGGTASANVWLDYYVPNNGGVSTGSNFAGRIYAVSSGTNDYSDNSIRIAVPIGGSATPVDTLTVKAGNVGIGTSSPGVPLNVATPASGTGVIFGYTSGTNNPRLWFSTNESASTSDINATGSTGNNNLTFSTSNNERARIDSSGNLLVGTTAAISSTNPGFYYEPNGALSLGRTGTGTVAAVYFYNGNGVVGQINTSGTSTAYVTSSDYRLKENVKPMTDGLATVAALKPVRYDWISDKSAGEGFIAHELQAVIPQAVTGEKDAVDENGKPIHQGVDYSKIVVHLVAAVKELSAKVAALEGTK